jgi:phosphatidylglycerol---prolipoprotein diacylglyceryl transferase
MLRELVHIGNFRIPSWGVMVMIGFLLSVWRGSRNAERYGMKREDLWDCCLIGLFGGVVGGRLVYVALEWASFKDHPLDIFKVWEGGMTSFGGIIGGVIAGVLAARARKYKLWDSLDIAAVSLPIGYAVGRIGCLLNGCCYGSVCDLPWALRFPDEHNPGQLTPPSHPAQIYEAIATMFSYFILVWLEKRRAFAGELICVYAILFAIVRFVIEGFRAGATAGEAGKITEGQIACIVIAVIAVVVDILLYMKHKKSLETKPA